MRNLIDLTSIKCKISILVLFFFFPRVFGNQYSMVLDKPHAFTFELTSYSSVVILFRDLSVSCISSPDNDVGGQ